MVSSPEEKPIERGDCEREKGTAVPLVGVGTGGGCFGGGKCGGSRAESTTAAHGSGTTADRFPVSARRQVQRRINLKIFKFLFPLNKSICRDGARIGYSLRPAQQTLNNIQNSSFVSKNSNRHPMNRVMRPPHSTDVSFIQKPKKLATRGQADAIPALAIRFCTCRVICIISSPTSLKHRTTRAPSCGIRSFPNSENPATSCSKLKFRRVAKLIHFNFFKKKEIKRFRWFVARRPVLTGSE